MKPLPPLRFCMFITLLRLCLIVRGALIGHLVTHLWFRGSLTCFYNCQRFSYLIEFIKYACFVTQK
jgi:hypothetical protein